MMKKFLSKKIGSVRIFTWIFIVILFAVYFIFLF